MSQAPNQDYRESHKAPDYGKAYHETFETHGYRKYVWSLEKNIISNIITQYYSKEILSHLDFACGTGRILALLENRTIKSTGVDISDSMLEIASTQVTDAQLVSGDLTRINLLPDRQFSLITAFRFFLRAQPKLRSEVMGKLVAHLAPGGYVIFNIHNNTTSISNNISKLYTKLKYGSVSYRDEMSRGEVRKLVESHGLTIVDSYPYGTFPVFREEQSFPGKLVQFFDKITKSKYLSTYVIYVCKKQVSSDAK